MDYRNANPPDTSPVWTSSVWDIVSLDLSDVTSSGRSYWQPNSLSRRAAPGSQHALALFTRGDLMVWRMRCTIAFSGESNGNCRIGFLTASVAVRSF
jgi:hypothetical protein